MIGLCFQLKTFLNHWLALLINCTSCNDMKPPFPMSFHMKNLQVSSIFKWEQYANAQMTWCYLLSTSDFFNWTLSDRFDADVFIPRLTFAPKGERYEVFNKNPSWDKWKGQVTYEELEGIKKEFTTLAEVGTLRMKNNPHYKMMKRCLGGNSKGSFSLLPYLK